MRYVIYKSANGHTYTIPEMWLAGRALMREREGFNPYQAHVQAITDWVDQLTAEQRYNAKRKGGTQ